MSAKHFEGKTAIVTGAGSGIGFALAKKLTSEGARVILNDKDEALVKQAVKAIEANDRASCLGCAGDAGDVDFIAELVDFAVRKTGRLDLCVANAGMTHFGSFLECKPEDYQRVTELNLKGSYFLVQESVKQMKAQGIKGRILLMSSVAGVQACPNLSLYAMTKAALRMMAKSLVVEMGPLGIGINVVAPGATITDRTLQEEADYDGTWSRLTPNKKPASVEDIAEAGSFLLSDAASHITGQTLIVDGGWTSISPYPGFFD